VAETHNDVEYAKAWVERVICEEVQRIAPTYHAIRAKVAQTECFWGLDAELKWRHWKEGRTSKAVRSRPRRGAKFTLHSNGSNDHGALRPKISGA
jgi:hypothetical protein